MRRIAADLILPVATWLIVLAALFLLLVDAFLMIHSIAEARLDLERRVIAVTHAYDLTPLELQSILNQIAAAWLKSAIQQEREEDPSAQC